MLSQTAPETIGSWPHAPAGPRCAHPRVVKKRAVEYGL